MDLSDVARMWAHLVVFSVGLPLVQGDCENGEGGRLSVTCVALYTQCQWHPYCAPCQTFLRPWATRNGRGFQAVRCRMVHGSALITGSCVLHGLVQECVAHQAHP